ncbi:sulfatase [Roseomonas sp. AR75]|uniref:sulfatase family protein n=1 Tax=Roseomonas sp. AR75 TaxID=2562311 RepID=UPI00197CC5AD|nr:sulfatase-like hydrolase/transferase [Roseomonas sp. AR75]
MERPNILFIVVDDCGYADLSCCGQTDFRTPNLDRMAAEGARFTQAYANAPLCTNTRVAIITGQYQYRHALGLAEPLRHSQREDPSMGIPPGFPTMPEMLRRAGYRTALIGKWHLGYLPRFGPLKSGYESFFGIMGGYTGYFTHVGDGFDLDLYEGETTVDLVGYTTDLLSDRATAYVDEAGDAPFFLSLHYTAPHWPWSAPSDEAAARERELVPSELAEGGSPRIYAEMMGVLDAGIGRVMEAVRRLKARTGRDTLVVFTSDNGGERYSKNWPFVGRKWDLLEGGLRVPQIAWWPGRIAAGRVTDQVAITMDLSATCFAAAGVAPHPDHPLDGMDLLPLLSGAVPEQERTLYWRMANRSQRAVRQGRWKYLKVAEREFLFDIAWDPRERGNLAEKQPERLKALRHQWEQWDATMLPAPANLPAPFKNLSDMLW